MPAALRLSDQSTGHDGWPPTPAVTSSGNVFINGLGAVRISDQYQPHTHLNHTHTPIQSKGSPNVFINGLAAARIGDELSCGDMSAQGSSNVFVN